MSKGTGQAPRMVKRLSAVRCGSANKAINVEVYIYTYREMIVIIVSEHF